MVGPTERITFDNSHIVQLNKAIPTWSVCEQLGLIREGDYCLSRLLNLVLQTMHPFSAVCAKLQVDLYIPTQAVSHCR